MLLALIIFAGNGLYQHRSWWVKGGRETHYMDVDILTQMPAGPAAHHHLGDHYEVCGMQPLLSNSVPRLLANGDLGAAAA
jgi:hypothetical protein